MQENRSFDHYYGTMRGVRGFGDRITVPLPRHRSVWRQRSRKTRKEVLPFLLDSSKTRAQCVSSLDHGCTSGHEAWNRGKYDDWIDAKSAQTMGYYMEGDIPFQFALANAFTIRDAYFCSVMGPTDPNRVYHWTGSINPPENRAGGSSITISLRRTSPRGSLVRNASRKRVFPGASTKKVQTTTKSGRSMATTAIIRSPISGEWATEYQRPGYDSRIRKRGHDFRSLTATSGRSSNSTAVRPQGHSATSRAFRSKRETPAQLSGLRCCGKTFGSRSACCGASK